jgi:hypothetical protein
VWNCSSPNIIVIIKLKRMSQAGQATLIGELSGVYKATVGTSEERVPQVNTRLE